MSETKYSPMITQYLKVKENYPDTLVFYRVGDFYEMFFEDAQTASRELDLVLTGKAAGVEEKVPMCGVPHHAVSSYVQRLVQRGYKIAIVEQMQDPKEAKGIVERDVIRVITPGTVMEEITDEKASVFLSAVEDHSYGYCLSMAEASTGESVLLDIPHSAATLVQTLLRNNVREVVVSHTFDEKLIQSLREMQIIVSYCEETEIKEVYLPLCEKLKKDYQRIAYGRMINYLEATQRHMLAHLQTAVIESESEVLYMDFSTIQNLELIDPIHRETKGETLWTFLDMCKSAMGSRLLKKWIEKPLVNQQAIEARYDRLEYLKTNFLIRKRLRDHIGGIYDLQRLIGRCAMNSANAQDCLRLSKTLNEVPAILNDISSEVFPEFASLDPLEDLRSLLDGAFVDNPPASISDGGVFRDGYNKELDEAREIQRNGRQFISNMEAAERERTGIKTLRIGYNKVFRYYIDISKAAAAQVKEEWGYIRKQTLVNNERFISPELKEKEEMILHAEENAIRLEKQLFAALLSEIRARLAKLQRLSTALAELDCYATLAEVCSKYGYVRPVFTNDEFAIVQGRHPILNERMKKTRYVANDLSMNEQESILLITGPNMGGKSTYMRQTALIVIMAQIGCYVPAAEVRMPVFDKIFTRIGASDDILSGQSTFMVEMAEANRALQEATAKS
ncbi:MAG: DNA mismatch repair protein MutS, partial [Solobacterium sp.]|nr:DNA mismatch repair protein MutS [Solobacterium sp.]